MLAAKIEEIARKACNTQNPIISSVIPTTDISPDVLENVTSSLESVVSILDNLTTRINTVNSRYNKLQERREKFVITRVRYIECIVRL